MIMAALPKEAVIGVIGAGAMGAGIAQVAAQAGHPVLVYDAKEGAAAKGVAGIGTALAKLVEKGKMTSAAKDAVMERLAVADSLAAFAPAGLAVEAIIEDLAAKRSLFQQLEAIVGDQTILATNTSSISITAIANGLKRPGQMVGLHFFNPAPLMALVEVVSGLSTDPAVAATVHATAAAWGKSPVQAKSTPGFIVNRVARPYYGEALRVLQEGGADVATIDAVAREAGGFRLGPFELMDMIGHDVNFAVTNSVWRAYFRDPRYQPSLIQQELVEAGWLGRKSGRGFYDYGKQATPPAAATAPQAARPQSVAASAPMAEHPLVARLKGAGISVERCAGDTAFIVADGAHLAPSDGRSASVRAAAEETDDLILFDVALDFATCRRLAVSRADQASDHALNAAVGLLQAAGIEVSVFADVPGLILTRTVAMLANEAAEAVNHGVAEAPAVDTAMLKGVSYPIGPLAWAERIGLSRVLATLDNLQAAYGEDRYRPSTLLRRKAASGQGFLG
jgi:3-hydroxybutyryl-CoA dehydrogenase